MAHQSKKPNPVDNILRNLSTLPPAIDLAISGAAAIYALFAIFVDNQRAVGLGSMLIALIFAVIGIMTLSREMKLSKMVTQMSSPDILPRLQHKQFESYISTLFALGGYRVRLAIDEIHRADDADLIAERKKETLLIQFNHYDDDGLTMKSVQSLQKAAAALRATGAVAITFGRIDPEVANWASRKGVQVMGLDQVLEYAERLTGEKTKSSVQPAVREEVVEEVRHEVAEVAQGRRRYLFVDFEGLSDGWTNLGSILAQHPAYHVIAATLPKDTSIDQVRSIADCGDRVIGELPPSGSGRYFAIQKYLQDTPEGKQATWLALDAQPRQYPEGCSELVAINGTFGFDQPAAQRLLDAMLLVDRRNATAGG